jgi:hypothetical protein
MESIRSRTLPCPNRWPHEIGREDRLDCNGSSAARAGAGDKDGLMKKSFWIHGGFNSSEPNEHFWFAEHLIHSR